MISSALYLSKYIVTKCIKERKPISNLHLQRILYYIQREYLKRDMLAFEDEFEAWQVGPVIREVYYYFCGNGAMPIISEYKTKIAKSDRRIIDPIIIDKRDLEPWILVEDINKHGGAWDITYNKGQSNRAIIDRHMIKDN